VRGDVVVLGVRGGRADEVVLEIRRGLGGEQGGAGVLVAALAGEALLVAVVGHRLTAGEVHQLVGEQVPAEQFGVAGLRQVASQESADAAHVVVAEEGRQRVRVGVGVPVVLGVQPPQPVGGLTARDVRPRGLLEGEVERRRRGARTTEASHGCSVLCLSPGRYRELEGLARPQ
jgi:hypothetical protein